MIAERIIETSMSSNMKMLFWSKGTKNRAEWNIGIATDLYPWIDGEVWAVEMQVVTFIKEQ